MIFLEVLPSGWSLSLITEKLGFISLIFTLRIPCTLNKQLKRLFEIWLADVEECLLTPVAYASVIKERKLNLFRQWMFEDPLIVLIACHHVIIITSYVLSLFIFFFSGISCGQKFE